MKGERQGDRTSAEAAHYSGAPFSFHRTGVPEACSGVRNFRPADRLPEGAACVATEIQNARSTARIILVPSDRCPAERYRLPVRQRHGIPIHPDPVKFRHQRREQPRLESLRIPLSLLDDERYEQHHRNRPSRAAAAEASATGLFSISPVLVPKPQSVRRPPKFWQPRAFHRIWTLCPVARLTEWHAGRATHAAEITDQQGSPAPVTETY